MFNVSNESTTTTYNNELNTFKMTNGNLLKVCIRYSFALAIPINKKRKKKNNYLLYVFIEIEFDLELGENLTNSDFFKIIRFIRTLIFQRERDLMFLTFIHLKSLYLDDTQVFNDIFFKGIKTKRQRMKE